MPDMRILVVDDDPEIAELLTVTFGREGWKTLVAADGMSALSALAAGGVDACVLDLMLPGMDGLTVLKRMKSSPVSARVPVVISSAKGEDADIVAGLELGADDYVVKPFSPRVLVARLRAVLRRDRDPEGGVPAPARDEPVVWGGLWLHPGRHEVREGVRAIDLSATEFSLLELFMRNPGRVFTRTAAIARIRGADYPVTDRALDVHILSLRRKLGEKGSLIETVRGVGYRLKD